MPQDDDTVGEGELGHNVAAGALGEFLLNNPWSTLDEERGLVREPWGDETVRISLPEEPQQLIDTLNAVQLPPLFTALRHLDTQDVEFFFAPLRKEDDLVGRGFEFYWEGAAITCEWGEASERLELIARHTTPLGPPSDSRHRNTPSIRQFLTQRDAKPETLSDFVVTSFWLRHYAGDDEALSELARHLNFFMTYFDRSTPIVMLVEPSEATPDPVRQHRYPFEAFPTEVVGRKLDPHLLGLWEGTHATSDMFRRFLYYYQILEYAAFYSVRSDLEDEVRRILHSPEATSNLRDVSKRILDALSSDRRSDEQKMVETVGRLCDPQKVWTDISDRIEFLSTPTEFDGGYRVDALARDNWTSEDFAGSWIPKLPHSLRGIRNALVHSREKREANCILPTRANAKRLQPFVAVISNVALQIMTAGD